MDNCPKDQIQSIKQFLFLKITLALASLAASASAAMARWSWTGRRTSFLLKCRSKISSCNENTLIDVLKSLHFHTLSLKSNKKRITIFYLVCKKDLHFYPITLTPHGSVASSKAFCITWLIVSRSDRISAKFFVPRTFRKVVAASRRVEWLKQDASFEKYFSFTTSFIILNKIHL